MSTLCKDYKTTLQEVTQSEFGTTPIYKLVSSSGPDHLKEFVVAVYINDKFYADAKGKSKKIAQQLSAELTLKILEKINE
jgi:ribonuclease-3